MVKGILLDIFHNNTEANPLLLTYKSLDSFVGLQDSLPKTNKSTIRENTPAPQPITGTTGHKGSTHTDTVFARNDAREHVAVVKKVMPVSAATVSVSADTMASLKLAQPPGYEHTYVYPENINFLSFIHQKTLSSSFDYTLLQKKDTTGVPAKIAIPAKIVAPPLVTGHAGHLRLESTISWLPLVLLLSLFAFSWIKIMYQKYVMQVVVSIVNYQVALRLLRERNVLFRNMAFGLNFIFIINLGLFIFFLLDYFSVKPFFSSQIFNYIIYCLAVSIFFNVKNFFCVLLGIIFKYQEEFSEYNHNENLFNKNIGLLLFPIVILFPYVTDNYKQIVLYSGIFFFGIMILLRTLRGFQIIIRKGVSTFYMILYLCAIEILPVLILLKYSMTLI